MPRTKPTKQSKVHYPKVSPRLLERYANIDGRCTDEIKNRNDWIRKVLEDAVEHGVGFDKVKNKKNKALKITFADTMRTRGRVHARGQERAAATDRALA